LFEIGVENFVEKSVLRQMRRNRGNNIHIPEKYENRFLPRYLVLVYKYGYDGFVSILRKVSK
jgi:hypothetical protein